jgi:biotin-(acetyl-CoA carboxylase) ligase
MMIAETTRTRGDVIPTAWTSSYASSFVASAAPTTLSASLPRRRPLLLSETTPPLKDAVTSTSTCEDDEIISTHHLMQPWSSHPDDPSLWLYHIETTTSTMDEARKFIIDGKLYNDDNNDRPKSFLISATSQSAGRGTSQRNWQSSKRGNALFTIGIHQSSWMDGLKFRNDGRAVPLTLLPLKIGSLVATRIRDALQGCIPKTNDDNNSSCDDDSMIMPMVTVKWPNDILLRNSTSVPHEKIAGILIETSEDWFLIGIGINVGYAPSVPSDGDNRGRDATCLARYCHADSDDYIVGAVEEIVGVGYGPMKIIVPEIEEKEHRWIETSKQLAMDVAYDLHSWLYYDDNNAQRQQQRQIGESILEDWKSFVDWDMELTLRDTPNRERVTLEGVLEDGRVIVKEVETGQIRTLVADYFL